MKKYTFIVEYRKGTYIQQIVSQNLEESVLQWVQNLETFNIPNLGIKEKMSLEKAIRKELPPTKIKEIENVWCLFISVRRSHLLMNIVETANANF